MNQRIQKIIDEIERTKAKITELQALLPELERKRVEMENNEIIRLVRSTSIAPADLPEFLESIKTINSAEPEPIATTTPTSEASGSETGDEKSTSTEEDDSNA